MLFCVPLVLGLFMAAPGDYAVTETRQGYRYETPRASVRFDRGELTAEQRLEFVHLADQGVDDVRRLLKLTPSAKLTFRVSRRTRISQARGTRIALPYQRVVQRSAPYLHETVHALLSADGRDAPMWLSEGLASYVESRVAETMGGYNAAVFFQGGNGQVDAEAAKRLANRYGLDALDAVGTSREPRGIRRDRENVARPFYLLSQSFVKFLSERVGLDAVVLLHRHGGELIGRRPLSEWKREWATALRRRGPE